MELLARDLWALQGTRRKAGRQRPGDDELCSPSPEKGLGPARRNGQGAQRSAKKPRAKETALLTSSRDSRDTPLVGPDRERTSVQRPLAAPDVHRFFAWRKRQSVLRRVLRPGLPSGLRRAVADEEIARMIPKIPKKKRC